MKCAGASTCVPVCAPKFSAETFALSPLDKLRKIGNLDSRIAGPGGQFITAAEQSRRKWALANSS